MKKIKAIIPAAISVIALIAAIIIALSSSTAQAPIDNLSVRFSTAQQYLVELDFDRAIAEFEAMIQIDPKNADAYLGLAKAYEGKGVTDKAIEVLEQGYAQTGDERLKEMLEQLKGIVPDIVETLFTETETKTETSAEMPTSTDVEFFSDGSVRCHREEEENGYALQWYLHNGILNLIEHYDNADKLINVEWDGIFRGNGLGDMEYYEPQEVTQDGYVISKQNPNLSIATCTFDRNGHILKIDQNDVSSIDTLYEYPDEDHIKIQQERNMEPLNEFSPGSDMIQLVELGEDGSRRTEYYFEDHLMYYSEAEPQETGNVTKVYTADGTLYGTTTTERKDNSAINRVYDRDGTLISERITEQNNDGAVHTVQNISSGSASDYSSKYENGVYYYTSKNKDGSRTENERTNDHCIQRSYDKNGEIAYEIEDERLADGVVKRTYISGNHTSVSYSKREEPYYDDGAMCYKTLNYDENREYTGYTLNLFRYYGLMGFSESESVGYDKNNRMTFQTVSRTENGSETWSYGENGNLTYHSIRSADGIIESWTYDSNGNEVSHTKTD